MIFSGSSSGISNIEKEILPRSNGILFNPYSCKASYKELFLLKIRFFIATLIKVYKN
jgi:hypothetical protein